MMFGRKTKVLIAVVGVVVVTLIAMTMMKPDRMIHYEAIKKKCLIDIDHEMNSNPETKEYAAIGTYMALEATDKFLMENLIVYEHTYYNLGVIIMKDYHVPVSIGVMGQVFILLKEKDLTHLMKNIKISDYHER